jgi:hypothetical protein
MGVQMFELHTESEVRAPGIKLQVLGLRVAWQ